MNSDVPAEPSTSAFEDFLAGKPVASPVPGDATGIVVPPVAPDDSALAWIAANIRAELTRQLRSEATEVLPAGMTVRAHGNVGEFLYQPDVIVDADLPPAGAGTARSPRVIFEVAAAGSERARFVERWQIYRALPTLEVYVLVDAAQMVVTLYRRGGETWKTEIFEDPDDQLFLPTIHCLLSLETIYARVFSDGEEEEDQMLSSEPKITLS